MTVGHSFHQQYYGTATGTGLKRNFNLLKQQGLSAPATQGNFYQTLTEALLYIAEACFHDLWCVVGEVDSLAQLRELSPERLSEIVNIIVDKYASTDGLNKQREWQDNVLIQAVQENRDILDVVLCS